MFFWPGFLIILLITLNKFDFKNTILLMLLKKVTFFIIFVILLIKYKHNL